MPIYIDKKHLKSKKINKALNAAMFTLLTQESFNKITVNGICNEALVSRATFYAYYADKYDMLRYWLLEFQPYILKTDEPFEMIEENASRFLKENEQILKNLIYCADNETLDIICGHILAILDVAGDDEMTGEPLVRYTVLSNFYSGGIIYYLTWQIKNNFPSDIPAINIYLYQVIEKLRELETA